MSWLRIASDVTDQMWTVDLICCGRRAGTEVYATWDAAEAFRRSYVDNAGGHERVGIIRLIEAAKAGEQ